MTLTIVKGSLSNISVGFVSNVKSENNKMLLAYYYCCCGSFAIDYANYLQICTVSMNFEMVDVLGVYIMYTYIRVIKGIVL